jgi:hypothetical protein
MDTLLAGLSDAHLCARAHAELNPLTSTTLERELLARLEAAELFRPLIDALAGLELDELTPVALEAEIGRLRDAESIQSERIDELQSAARDVVDAWEDGNLADAVRELSRILAAGKC